MMKFRALPATLWRMILTYSRRLWVRVVIMGLLSFLTLAVTQVIEPLVPEKVAAYVSGNSADRLLNIIASAMLVVTTFSLTVMTSVFRSTASQWTPRVHRLILEDHTTQSTLATFIGAYVYALTAIIMRELGIFLDDRSLVLFLTTVLVLVLVVFYLVRWTLHLQTFGSLIDTTRQVEAITTARFKERLEEPCLGAHPMNPSLPPPQARAVRAIEDGYITQIFQESLQEHAEARRVDIYLTRPPGSYVLTNEPLAFVLPVIDGDEVDEDRSLDDMLRDHIVQSDLRSYAQDPRFGLMVMGEIGSKALSPGINDPGTAIDVMTRITRILSHYKDEASVKRQVCHNRLWIASLDPADLIDDGFGALARDGAANIEVQLRLQRLLAGLMQHPDPALGQAATALARREYRRAMQALAFSGDQERLTEAVGEDVRADGNLSQ